jgi:DNA-binding transcriptional ArsR family regulator
VGRVERELAADPGLTSRRDPRTGWTALHAVCASRGHLDPSRADGLLAVAMLLLDAGADPTALSNRPWSPLGCAVTSGNSDRANEPIVRLPLDRGAKVQDHDLYAAGFAGSWCVRMLLERVPDVAAIAEQALGGPISSGDVDTVRLLLYAGTDPTLYRDGDGHPAAVIPEALAEGAPTEMIELLLCHGADASAPGPDARSPYRLATALDRGDVVALLARHGARDDPIHQAFLLYSRLMAAHAFATTVPFVLPAKPDAPDLVAKYFRGLGDATRVRILGLLEESGELSVGELVAAVGQSQSKVSNHLACLRWCGFVDAKRDGRTVRYRVADERVNQVLALGRSLLADNGEHVAACGRIEGAPSPPRMGA